jgi:hypothetical protein
MFAFMDRINIGYAELQMKDALGFSASAFTLGASIFFSATCCFSDAVPAQMKPHPKTRHSPRARRSNA